MDNKIIRLFQPPHDDLLFETIEVIVREVLDAHRNLLPVKSLTEPNTVGFASSNLEARFTSQQVGGVYINLQVNNRPFQLGVYPYEVSTFAGLGQLVQRFIGDCRFSFTLRRAMFDPAALLFTQVLLTLHRRYVGPVTVAPQLIQTDHPAADVLPFRT